jgi:ABC-type Fe3+-hydroxamate transport system substrate-binding protein
MRIVSLLPSATELLCAAGGEHLLVGRSHECDFPPGVRRLPALTGARTDAASTPAAIDAQVRTALAAGRPLYTLDEPLLAELRPDLILTQDLCSVCSIDLASVRRVADRLGCRVLSLNATTVEGIVDDLLRVGEAAGLHAEASRAAVQLRGRLFAAQEYVPAFADGPTVGFLEWTDPLFIAGHWTVQLIERAGGVHPLNPTVPKPGTGEAIGPQQAERAAGKSIAVPPEVFAASRPEALIIAPCGLDLSATESAAVALARTPWFADLPAVRAGRVALVDGSQHFNRPGPRIAEALEFLVGWIHRIDGLIPPAFPWKPMRP